MKIQGKKIVAKNGSGYVRVSPETNEDVWHLYNLLSLSDQITMSTVRKVKSSSATGSVSSNKLRLTLTLKMDTLPVYDATNSSIRISGINSSESNHVKMGAAHTFTLTLNDSVRIEKDCWDAMHLDRLTECTDVSRNAELAGVVLQQTGLGHLCLITEHMTITKARIEVNIPKKHSANTGWGDKAQKKGISRFFELLYRSIVDHVDFTLVKAVLIGGPGYIGQDFFKYINEQATATNERMILENKDKFVLVHASSGHKHALDEVLLDENITSRLTDTKVARDVMILNKFMRMLDTDPDRSFYGFQDVKQADEQGAVETLLITDDMFRNSDTLARRQYVLLVESVKEQGGNVTTFSGMHHSGRTLGQISGVAAILRFPVGEITDAESSGEEEDPDAYFHTGPKLEKEKTSLKSNKSQAANGYGDIYSAVAQGMDIEEDDDEEPRNPLAKVRDDLNDMGF